MTENEILNRILERIGYSNQAQTIFLFDELNMWLGNIDRVKLFVENGILQKLSPLARNIECGGCEERCFKEVNIIVNKKNKKSLVARIICNERDDIGYANVDLRRLQQWQTNGTLLSNTITKLLKLTTPPQKNRDSDYWTLGMVKGKKHSDFPILVIENRIMLKIAGHDLPLIEILSFKNGKLLLDSNELIKRIDKPKKLPTTADYQTSTIQRDKRKIKTLERNKKILTEYEKIKKENPNTYNNAIAIEISEIKQFSGMTHSRILRIINEFKKN